MTTALNPAARISLSAKDLKRILRALQPAISRDEARYYICGICLEFSHHEGVTMTATDGYRLISYALGDGGTPAHSCAVILARKAVTIALKRLGRAKGQCELLVLSSTNVKLAYNGELVALECIDGTYPDWRRVVPDARHLENSINISQSKLKSALLPLIKEASEWQGRNLTAKLRFAEEKPVEISGTFSRPTFQEREYTVSRGKNRGTKRIKRFLAGQTETRPFEVTVCTGLIAGQAEVGINVRYLYDFLRCIKGSLTLCVRDCRSPILVGASDGATRVFMPYRLA